METTDLFYPQISVDLGKYTLDSGVKIEIQSSQESCSDWAKVRFTKQFQTAITLARKDAASISLGYNGVYDEAISGYISQPYNGSGNVDEVILKDGMFILEETTINKVFLDTTPQEIVKYFLAQAGITDMKLSSTVYQTRKRVPICSLSALKGINAVNAAWGISQKYFFRNGVFYWGVTPDQEKVYSFEYGINIISLTRTGGLWELETISSPFVRHSDKIAVTHPKIIGTFEVKKVVFLTNEAGFIRTYIYFN